MSRKVLNLLYQPDPLGPVFGKVADPVDFMNSEVFSHEHIERVTKDFLMSGDTTARVDGFAFTIGSGLSLSLSPGEAVNLNGLLFDTIPSAAQIVTFAAAHPSLDRIDLVYGLMETDAGAETAFRPYRQVRTSAELAAGVPAYLPQNFNNPTQQHNRVTLGVRAGTPSGSPTAPAAGANEVALYQVRVPAGATTLVIGNVTDVRQLIRTLPSVFSRLTALEGSAAFANLPEAVQDIVGAFLGVTPANGLAIAYNDAGNTLVLSGVAATATDLGMMLAAEKVKLGHLPDMTQAEFDARYVNIDGDVMTGDLRISKATSPQKIIFDQVGANGFGRLNLTSGVQETCFIDLKSKSFLPNSGSQIDFGINNTTASGYVPPSVYMSLLPDRLQVNTNLSITGTLSKAGGTFKYDHPLAPGVTDFIHGFTESNEYLLLYRSGAQLVDGHKSVDLDEALGFTVGTFDKIAADAEVFAISSVGVARVTAGDVITGDLIGNIRHTAVELTSTDSADTSQVRFVIIARRNDPFIHTVDNVDGSGRLICEMPKPEPSAEMLALLEATTIDVPEGSPLAGETVNAPLNEFRGFVGYPTHPELYNAELPTREVTYVGVTVQEE